MKNFPHLFEPIQIGKTTVKNRIFMPPLSTNLADKGYEVRECDGLGYIPGEIVRFTQTQEKERIPHVGWNEILKREDSPLFDGIADGTNYYFVHSYHFQVAKEENIATVTPYCGEFLSSVVKDNIVGTQFHPEKSQKAGFKLIKNFLSM